MTAAEVVQLKDRDWMPARPWSCPSGLLVTTAAVDRETWLRERRTGLGASDVAAVFGVSRWASPWDVWAEKVGRLQPEPETEPQKRGRILEDAIADLWVGLLPADQPIRVKRAGMMRHRQHPWMLATVDRLSVCRAGRCIVEIKSGTDLSEWDDGQFPLAYELQVQQQLAVTGRDHAHVVLLGPRFQIVERVARRDDAFIGDMVDFLGPWWDRHVVGGVEPAATSDSMDGLARLYGDADPDAVCDLPPELWSLREQVRILAAREAEIAKEREDLIARAKQAAGNASVLKAAGDVIATWKPTKKVAGVNDDWRRANPHLVAEYSVEKTIEVLDVDRLIEDHPNLIGDGAPLYRVRQFRLSTPRKQKTS